jgi:hypothetical protein
MLDFSDQGCAIPRGIASVSDAGEGRLHRVPIPLAMAWVYSGGQHQRLLRHPAQGMRLMDSVRFATLLHALSSVPSRRQTLRLLSGFGLAGVLGHVETRAKKKRKKLKKGTVCLNGQTLIVPRLAVSSLLAQGASPGACPPVSPPPPPPFCQGKPDLTNCGVGLFCSGGICAMSTGCKGPTSFPGCSGDGDCCSGFCNQQKCAPASAGQGCLFDPDCLGGNQCVGFVCQPF